jgi:hypothetical protein
MDAIPWGWFLGGAYAGGVIGLLLGVGVMALAKSRGRDERCQDCLTRVVRRRQEARAREEGASLPHVPAVQP